MVVGLVGRRIDAEDAEEPRFPPTMIPVVRERLRELFRTMGVTTLVSAAANGADLIGLEVAGLLGIRRVVILLADRDRFREGSVADRPGEWLALYDQIIDDVAAQGDLQTMGSSLDQDGFAKVNTRILDEASRIASDRKEPVQAFVVWNEQSRGDGDLTEEFLVEARRRGIPVLEIDTLSQKTH
jgi:hypothetical protein